MSTNEFSVAWDGSRYVFSSDRDGTVTTAHLAAGEHTETEHDQAIQKLRQAYPTVRQWAQDAATTNTNWPTMSAAQKDTATRETIRRLGLLLDHVAELMVTLNADV